MSRRQSVDRPGILSPPGPFLTPSPSPSIPASPRLQPSPSQSPFSHDVLIVTNNTITNTTQEQERKAATPSRRPSIHQINSGSPNAGTVVFQPSPSQSPAAAQTVVGITGNEFNTTLVGSNNISLNKKTGKRTPQSYINYGHGGTVATSGSFATSTVANSPKGSSKKASSTIQSPMTNPSSSPVTNESPIASPSSSLKPPTPQPMLQSLPVMNAGNHLLQFIQGPQLITAAQTTIANQQRSQQITSSSLTQSQNTSSGQSMSSSSKNSRGHQQILPKPQQTSSSQPSDKTSMAHSKGVTVQQQSNQIPQSSQHQPVVTSAGNQQQGGQQIILPTGNLNTQPLLLNQMPVIVQQNTPQGVQLILRPPTPQLAAPSLVIHNTRPQLQQPQPQQLLRILNTNGTMQLAAAPTFIVSSQANLIQQNLQTIKANTQTTPITQLSGLQTTPRSNIAAAFNSHIIGQSMAQLQNLQLNGNLAQIQMPNGLNGPIISQLPAQFQHLPAGFNQLNLNQLNSTNLQQQIAAAAAAAGAAAAFQSPPPPQVSEIQMPSVVSAQNIQFSANSTPVNLSQSVTPQPQLIQSVTPEPARNPTPTLQNVIPHQGTTTVLVQPDSAMPHQAATTAAIVAKATGTKLNSNDSANMNETQMNTASSTTKPPKKPKPRKKKAQTNVPTTTQTTITTSTAACSIAPVLTSSTASKPTKKDNQKQQIPQPVPQQSVQPSPVTSTGKLDLANVMKLCGIMEDDDYMDTETEPVMHQQQHEEMSKQAIPQQPQINMEPQSQSQHNMSVAPNSVANSSDIMITIPGQNSDIPFTFTIPTSHCDTVNQVKPLVTVTGNSTDPASIGGSNTNTELKSNASFDSQNIVIKIDQIDNVPPYTITIPREEIQQSIQLAQQQQQTQQHQQTPSNLPLQPQLMQQQQHAPRSVSVTINNSGCVTSLASSSSAPNITSSNTPTTFVNSHITLQSQINEIQNQLIGVTPTSSGQSGSMQMSAPQPSVQVTSTTVTSQQSVTTQISSMSTTTTPTTTTTTATVKPRRKPAAKRNGKKVETIPTPVGNVPSQIGNIQISQVDATKINANQSLPISNVVENKIQIMPIIDTSKTPQNQGNQQLQHGLQLQQGHSQPQLQTLHQQQPMQQQQFIPPSSIQTIPNDPNKNLTDNRNLHISAQPSTTSANISLPMVPHQNSPTATVFPQLTGSLSLTFEEDGGRFILRHDPNLPQDPQSQIILQAILSGALCNVTIVNEPFDKSKALKNNVTLNSSNVSVSSGNNIPQQMPQMHQQQPPQQNIAPKCNTLPQMQNNKNSLLGQQPILQPSSIAPTPSILSNVTSQPMPSNDQQKRLPEVKKSEPPMAMVNATPSIVVNPTSPKLVALPKVDANQQLFTLNTITNQITHISPNQTTAALGPMERLLIVPVGINAQQLAECLSQGQIHFNNIGQATQASESHIQSQPQPTPQLPPQNLIPTSQPPTQIQQQIVRPQQHQSIQPLQQNPPAKQVANVAPIIDASKAKAEVKPKKAPKPRKPKACNENISKAVKPIKKLDLSTKPSANPVQIVQPNTATKDLPQNQQQQQGPAQHLMRGNSASNISTSASSNIHPFQTTQSGNKLVGVTAPMQQISQQQRNTMNNNQCNTSNSSNNLSTNTSNIMAVSNMASNQPPMPPASNAANNQVNVSGIHPAGVHLPTVTVTPKSQPDVAQQMPPLISVNATPPVPRIQTIQLTPQQQQLLKTVQTQIQQLSSRLQNKSLLANLNIPSDFNPSNPIYNKPLPQLNNIHSMNDTEIHAALQRLFIEQQKILASGKLIPTIPAPSPHAFMTSASPSPVPSQPVPSPSPSPTQAPSHQQQPLTFQNKPVSTPTPNLHNTTNLMPTTLLKNEGQSIPANIVQPNNHNSTANNSPNNTGNQQRIHIYPMQHQSQLQQPQPYLQQQPPPQQQIQPPAINTQPEIQAQHVQMQIHHLHPQQQQQPTQSISPQSLSSNTPRPLLQSTPIKQQTAPQFIQPQMQLTPPQQQQQQQQLQQPQQQQQTLSVQQQLQQISPSNLHRPNQFQPSPHQQSMSIPTTVTAIENAQKPVVATSIEATPPPPQMPTPSIVQPPTTPVTVTIKTESPIDMKPVESPAPVASPKPKIPRHCLFERQLKVDQDACINPDYMTPFQSKEDAVKRLIRYHCMYQQDETIPSDEEEELEKLALNFKEKFREIANKYQYLLLQESMRLHRTSELCLVNELLVTDAQTELKELREEFLNAASLNSNIYHQTTAYTSNMLTSNNTLSSNNSKLIKKEPESGVQMSKLHSEDFHLQSEFQQQQRQYHHASYQTSQPFGNSQTTTQELQQFRHINNPNLPHKSLANPSGNSSVSVKSEIKSEPRDMIFDKCDNQNPPHESNKVMNNRTLAGSAGAIGSSAANDANLTGSVSMSSVHAFNNSCNKNFNNFTVKDEKDRNIYSNNSLDIPTTNTTFSSSKNSNFVKREMDSFDIESEITPSFIMKKMESNSSSNQMPPATNAAEHDSLANNGFSMDYFMSSNSQTTAYGSTNSSSLHVSEQLNVKKKEEDDVAKAEQYDEWLCIQKELNLITEKKAQVNITNHEQKLSEIFDTPSNKSVENHLSDLFNSNSSVESTMETSSSSNKDHHNMSVASNLHLSEFFNPDSIASKSVENRLEAMFGGSPVVEKTEQDTVESRLEEIFNGSTSPQSHYAMINTPTQNKRQWNSSGDLMTPNTSASSTANNYNKQRSCMVSSYLEESHVTSNHPRWIIDQNQFDFITDPSATAPNDSSSGRSKRSWNGDISSSIEHLTSNKKMCFNSKVESDLEHDLLGLGSSESNDAIANELHNMSQHSAMQDNSSHMHQNMTHLHNNIMMQMQASGTVHHMQQQQQPMHDHQQHHPHHHHPHHQQMQANTSLMSQSSSIFENTMNNTSGNANMSGSSSSTSISSNFDEDINRHVQNAIDSILNLHSSENDSLNFSLEHSMGSFLTDSPLDQPSHHNPAVIQGSATNTHCVLSSSVGGKQRRHLNRMDDLGDCLISGAGMGNQADNGGMMVDSPTSVVMSGGANVSGNGMASATMADFSCVTGIEEAVKSIMTS